MNSYHLWAFKYSNILLIIQFNQCKKKLISLQIKIKIPIPQDPTSQLIGLGFKVYY